MALIPDPFNPLLGLQEALEAFRASGWLQSGPSGGGSYPPLNIFRKGDDLVLIAEVPGIAPSVCPAPRLSSMATPPACIVANDWRAASIAR